MTGRSGEADRGRQGFLLGLTAYALWGLFPAYWPLLEPAGSVELLAHRILWSAVLMLPMTFLLRRGGHLRTILTTRRTLLALTGAACVITVNWGFYIWSVTHEHVVEASLGYFINPLVTVCAGVVVFGERLRTFQWAAVALAGLAVLGLTIEQGRPPWIALVLAGSFASYGVLRKLADVGTIEGLTVETTLLAPLAIGYLVWLQASGGSAISADPPWHQVLLVSAGVATSLPLLCFGAAATRVSLTTLGLLQYVAPSLQFLWGVTVGNEEMSPIRWVGFAVIWVALAVFSADSLRGRRVQRLQVEASAV